MTAVVIDGKAIAAQRQEALRSRIEELSERGITPCLVAVSIGDDPAWQLYSQRQARSCAAVGIAYRQDVLPAAISQEACVAHIEGLNADTEVHGVLIQSPLPEPLQLEALQSLLSPSKDVEGVHPANLGLILAGRHRVVPCTALSAVSLIQAVRPDLRGLEVVIVGASVIVGRPIAELVLAGGGTPTVCHIDTADLAFHTRRADVLVVAVGKAGLITADMVQPGAVVIDVGINRVPTAEGKSRIVGDVDPGVAAVASHLTPVPGGVGALTTTILLEAVVAAAEQPGHRRMALSGHALVRALGEPGLALAPELADRLAALLSSHLVSLPADGVIRPPLLRRLDEGLLIGDGGVGTALLATGLAGERLERVNTEEPDRVAAVHRAFISAGSELITANTFACNRFRCGDAETAIRQAQAGVRLARREAFGKALVVASIGPLGPVVGAEIDDDRARSAFAELALAMADAGADGFLVETMIANQEAAVAVAAIRSVSELPIIASRPFDVGDTGGVAEFVLAVEAAGADVVGVNCVAGLREVVPIITQLRSQTTLPIVVAPNGGYPLRDGTGLRYALQPAYFARLAIDYAAAGARLLSGCCGIGPEHIAALVARRAELRPPEHLPRAGRDRHSARPKAVSSRQHPWLEALCSGAFPTMALVPARLTSARAADALCELAAAGIRAGGLMNSWPGPSQQNDLIGARLRYCQDRAGIDGVLEIGAGMHRLREAQALLQGAHLLGTRIVLIDAGVFASGQANAGQWADTRALIELAANLNRGRDLSGNRLPEAAHFAIGVRVRHDQIGRIPAYAASGAEFVSLQPVYQPATFRALIEALDERLPLISEVLVLPDAATADAIDNEVPVLSVPERLKQRLASDPQEDVRGVLRFLGHWRARLAGACLLLPDERAGAAAAVLRGLYGSNAVSR